MSASKKSRKSPASESKESPLQAWDDATELLHVLVDTPKGSQIKFKLDETKGCYTISHILPPGAVFPYDFGSIPSTAADDGDPVDVLVFIEQPTFPGCLVTVRLLGAMKAEQTVDGKTGRNDRLIGAAEKSRLFRDWKKIEDVPDHVMKEIEHFFVSYNEERGRKFEVLGRVGAAAARRLVGEGERRFERKKKSKR